MFPKITNSVPPISANAKVGHLVHVKNEKSKEAVRPTYIVTNKIDKSLISLNKMLHNHTVKPVKLQQKPYIVKQTDVYLAPNQPPIRLKKKARLEQKVSIPPKEKTVKSKLKSCLVPTLNFSEN